MITVIYWSTIRCIAPSKQTFKTEEEKNAFLKILTCNPHINFVVKQEKRR